MMFRREKLDKTVWKQFDATMETNKIDIELWFNLFVGFCGDKTSMVKVCEGWVFSLQDVLTSLLVSTEANVCNSNIKNVSAYCARAPELDTGYHGNLLANEKFSNHIELTRSGKFYPNFKLQKRFDDLVHHDHKTKQTPKLSKYVGK